MSEGLYGYLRGLIDVGELQRVCYALCLVWQLTFNASSDADGNVQQPLPAAILADPA